MDDPRNADLPYVLWL